MILYLVLFAFAALLGWAWSDACKDHSGFADEESRREAEFTNYWDAGEYPTTHPRGGGE